MIMEKLFETRYQVYRYSDKIPNDTLAKDLLSKTYNLVASKQNIIPYNIYVLGPNCSDEKQKIYSHVQKVTGGGHNHNIKAPYNLIFTPRLVTKPNQHIFRNRYVCKSINWFMFRK